MSSHRVQLEDLLLPDECRDIDGFCRDHRGMSSLGALASFLRDTFTLTVELDGDIVSGYACDQSNLPGTASGLTRPAGERECALVLRACTGSRIPVTVAAGRSSLTGSATPEGGIILSLDRMTAPLIEVDREQRSVTAPVGIILEDMRNAVLEQSGGRLFFPVDPTSRCDAMVGGALSCNASGFVPGEAGAMRPWVTGIRIVTTTGHLIKARRNQYVSRDGAFVLVRGGQGISVPVPRYPRPSVKNASGPFSSPDGAVDLVDLMVGSEGIFALITACTLRLSERPDAYLDLFISLPGERHMLGLLSYLRDDHPDLFARLSSCEYFGPNCRKYMDHESRIFRADHTVGIYLQAALTSQTLDAAAERWMEILWGAPCTIEEDAVMVLLTDKDRKLFFEARHSMPANSLEEVKRRGTYTLMTDTVVPPGNFEVFLTYTHDLIGKEGLDYLVFGHLGDCHLHFMIMPRLDQLDSALAVYDLIVERSAALGGVYSGEHGTGKRKRGDFLKCYGEDAAKQVLSTKRAMDPGLILNRGNVIALPPL